MFKLINVIPTLGPGGAEAFVVDLSIALKQLGVDVQILVLCDVRGNRGNYLAEVANANGVPVSVVGAKRLADGRAVSGFITTLGQNRNANFLVHLPTAELVCALGACIFGLINFLKTPVLNRVIHNTRPPGGFVGFLNRVTKFFYSRSIACSAEVFKDLRTTVGVDTFIDNGVNIERLLGSVIEDNRNNYADDFSDEENVRSYRLVMVGSARYGLIGGQKGVDLAIEAIALLRSELPEVQLYIIGCPDHDKELIFNYAKTVGVERNVQVDGGFNNISNKLADISPDFCLLPSRHEGLPVTLLEYSCLGYPVIAADLPQVVRLSSNSLEWNTFEAGSSESLAAAIRVGYGMPKLSRSVLREYKQYATASFGMKECAQKYIAELKGER